MTSSANYWTTAEKVCTPLELEALRLRDQRGLTPARIAFVLNRSRWSIRERLDSADRKIHYALSTTDEETAA